MMDSNRRPDEEGIKTVDEAFLVIEYIPTADLMKKGLRSPVISETLSLLNSNRRPDEEGIKTQSGNR